MNNQPRWQLRFENFEKAYLLLHEIVTNYQIANLSELEQHGLVHYFEILIGLSWKLLKDYLQHQGYANLNSPKQVIRQAFKDNIIIDGETWLLALEQRNLTSHTYDKQHLETTINFIMNKFYPLARDLYQHLKDKQ